MENAYCNLGRTKPYFYTLVDICEGKGVHGSGRQLPSAARTSPAVSASAAGTSRPRADGCGAMMRALQHTISITTLQTAFTTYPLSHRTSHTNLSTRHTHNYLPITPTLHIHHLSLGFQYTRNKTKHILFNPESPKR